MTKQFVMLCNLAKEQQVTVKESESTIFLYVIDGICHRPLIVKEVVGLAYFLELENALVNFLDAKAFNISLYFASQVQEFGLI